MKKWCKNLQIQFEAIVRYFLEANRITKRYNSSVLEKANIICFEAGLPKSY